MAQEFRMDSDEVGAVVDGLAGLSAAMTDHVSGLGAQVAGAGQPWGTDETGDRFGGGGGGIVAYMQTSLQAMAAHAERVQRHAGELSAAAGLFEQADQDS